VSVSTLAVNTLARFALNAKAICVSLALAAAPPGDDAEVPAALLAVVLVVLGPLEAVGFWTKFRDEDVSG
jgi:hypothetical protein